MDVAVSCHTRCSLSDQTTMSSSHHTAKNIFHVEKYLMQTTGPARSDFRPGGAGSWCHHEAGLETAAPRREMRLPSPAPGLGPAEPRCGGHEEAGPDTCHPSRCHAAPSWSWREILVVNIHKITPIVHFKFQPLQASVFELKNLFYILLFTTH